MLVVIEKGKEEAIRAIFSKWDLHAENIGEIIEGDRLVIRYHGKTVADVSPHSLVLGGGAPVYHREQRRPAYLDQVRAFDVASVAEPEAWASPSQPPGESEHRVKAVGV